MSKRKTPPPPPAFFENERPTLGSRGIRLTLGTLALHLEGLDDSIADGLIARFAPFATDLGTDLASGAGDPAATLRFAREELPHFIEPPASLSPNDVRLLYDAASGRVSYMGYCLAGWFDSDGGCGTALLSRSSFETPEQAIDNYVRSVIAWQSIAMGGALVHAASAVFQDRGYLFYGESGAGKSTLSNHNTRGRILSDDLSLTLPDPSGRLCVVSSPFRGTYKGPQVDGMFPLSAGFRLIQSPAARVEAIPRVLALSQFIGNLPFVADSFSRRPDLFDRIQQTLEPIALAQLHFRKDETYWDAIVEAGY